MRNARNELFALMAAHHLDHTDIEAATITLDKHYGKNAQVFNLRLGHTFEQWREFSLALDFEYDAGYGGQELYGTIWFKGSTWAERGEYDGSEWWEYRERPELPKKLKG